jgi:protoheme IX farnesyltransferase
MSFILDLFRLCKLKVVGLILITAIVGMFLSVPAPYLPDLFLVLIATAGIGMSAASAAVFNHIIDEQADIKMLRTENRPLPQKIVSREQAFVWGMFLGITGLAILYFFVNYITMVLTFLSLIGYAVIYTIYLKRATPQNIVIGGAAGATPPILGWTSIAGTQGIEYSFLLFLIIFVWTPPHFWFLAIDRIKDYKGVNIPMLPVTHGLAYTKLQILLYTLLLFIVALLPYLFGMSGLIYLLSAVVLGAVFIYYAVKTYKDSNQSKIAIQAFAYSVQYLTLLFIALLVDHYWLITL